MADVQFSQEQYAPTRTYSSTKGIPALVVKWGLARTEKEANMLLLGTAGLCIIAAIALPFFFGSSDKSFSSEEYTQDAMNQSQFRPSR